MAHIPKGKTVKVRSEREDQSGTPYVVIAGAPRHYIGGYGVVVSGDIITLPPGVLPGKWLEAIAESDAVKIAADPALAEGLAEKAADRKKEGDEVAAEAQRQADEAAAQKLKDAGAAALAAAGGSAVVDPATTEAEAKKLSDAAKSK